MNNQELQFFKEKKETLIYVNPNGEIVDLLCWGEDGKGVVLGDYHNYPDSELMSIHGYIMKFKIIPLIKEKLV